MLISADYSGGNIRLHGMYEENGVTHVYLEQDLTGTKRWWFYWNFRVDFAPAGDVEFHFLNRDVVCPRGPAVSADGRNWDYQPELLIDNKNFRYTFDGSGQSRWFAFCIPYVFADLKAYQRKLAQNPLVEQTILTVSEQGRDIPAFTFGSGSRNVFFASRAHCCEATGSFTLEGVIDELLTNERMLRDFRFFVVPMLDIDGVENGDQGKDRIPHDHNRDYLPEPHFAVIRALQKLGADNPPYVFIDFHSPWNWGEEDDKPHIHLSVPTGHDPELQDVFVANLRSMTKDLGDDKIIFNGVAVPTSEKDWKTLACIGDGYFRSVLHAELSVTLETPYSGNRSKPYSAAMLREWGHTVAKVLAATI